MKLLFITVLVVAVAIISTDAWFNRRVHRHQRHRQTSSSSSSSSSSRGGCLRLCLRSPVKEKLVEKICSDPCDGKTCNGNGNCNKGRCNCFPDFTGCDCETEIDPCRNVNCENSGNCVDGNCTCLDGFSGELCEEDRRCDNITCLNNGTCDGGICNCTTEFLGDTCGTNCNTVQGSCRRIENMQANMAGFNDFRVSNIEECERTCLNNTRCLSYDFFGGNSCGLHETDIISTIGTLDTSAATVGICTACN